MWGIIPAAGLGTRIQPLAFSKELLPVGMRSEAGQMRPKAIGEYLLDRLAAAGARKACFVISPTKSDIVRYFGARVGDLDIAYVVQPQPSGLCDALFRAAPLIHPSERVLVGLPDTVWFPADGLRALPPDRLGFLLFPVDNPSVFDAVVLDADDRVMEIQVKTREPASHWIWGALAMPGAIFHELHQLWIAREREDEYFGSLVNAWLADGGEAVGVRAGDRYVDVGTLHGYREAIALLGDTPAATP